MGELLDKVVENPLALALALAVLLAVFLGVRAIRKRERKVQEEGHVPGLDDLVREGKYLQAGYLAEKYARSDLAIEMYLRGQEPARAAQVASRQGNARRAAELFERGGDLERAADHYQSAGMLDKAREVRESMPGALRDKAKARDTERSGPPNKTTEEPVSSDAEEAFRRILEAGDQTVEGKIKLQEAGAQAAETLLRAGNIRRAAEVYRDAGLHDEAIHLYVNVLGAPGEAAPLVGARGNHERAAELYELAGQLERAAGLWVKIARSSSQPETYVDRIERLSEELAIGFLREETAARPLSKQTAELHYRFARALERRGDTVQAIDVYVTLRDRVGDYSDVPQRLATLKSPTFPPAKPSSHPPPAREAPTKLERAAKTPAGSGRPPAVSSRYSQTAGRPDPEPEPPIIELDQIPIDQISAIVEQVARAAIEEARRGAVLAPLDQPAAALVTRRTRAERPAVLVVGLEQAQLSLEPLSDSAAVAARIGPSIESLRGMTGGRPCDLGNIEVYYRMGLAHLASGQWQEALAAFDAVEEASPGYRDADRRAEHIRKWQKAMGPHMSLVAPRASPSAPEPSRYQIHGELGRGGMAVVYRARDEILGRDVALKFLSEELTAKQGMRELFQREARSVAQLNHPNIITVYDYGLLEGKAFICMEYVDGTSIESMVERRGHLTVVESLRIARQVLEALDYAHGQRIIHRDIKPSNMMRTKTGLVKLMDFGLAKSLAAGAKASIVAGTPAYMPPEQFAAGEIDERADLFAVGCSLYEMLTGALPFESTERNRPAPSVRDRDATLPALLETVVSRAIELDPVARFQTAAEFLGPVKRILDAVDSYSGGDGTRDTPVAP